MDTSPHKSDLVNVNGIRLHYLDWGGDGPALLFLTGTGSSAHIYDKFAPRFIDKFHAIALTRRGHGDSDYPETGYDLDTLTEDVLQFFNSFRIDKAVLVGHSVAKFELFHFAALYPERISKLIFLDPAYDRSSPAYKAIMEKNPLKNIQNPCANEDYYSIEEYVASIKRCYPILAAVWGEVMDEEVLHTVQKNPEGKIIDKMPANIARAFNDTLNSYTPQDSKIQAPVLSIFAIPSGEYYLSHDYMTEEQKASIAEFYETIRPPFQRELIQEFQRRVPHAKIVEIPNGHHICFIKHENLVFEEMRKFLLDDTIQNWQCA